MQIRIKLAILLTGKLTTNSCYSAFSPFLAYWHLQSTTYKSNIIFEIARHYNITLFERNQGWWITVTQNIVPNLFEIIQKIYKETSKTTFYNDQPHYNIIKKLKNSEILAISEKIQRDEKLSEYFKMFDKSLKLPY